ncbi:esterase family protein [Arthrobacter sp. N199823]|uniref:alpha/beta hydrolase n=1 Tax=Arthrobacter sp. N199823 TaxID=2058895 RepID=UPI0015E47130|nr:alpha/beta hydrolase-fold protein [Arthrobacter sp. N199823]
MLALLFLLVRRSLCWWLFALASAVVAAAVSVFACWAVIHVLYIWPEDLPTTVQINVALLLWILALGCTTALVRLRRSRDGAVQPSVSLRRRTLAVVAMVVALTTVGLRINADFGEFPTVRSLFSSQTMNLSTVAPPAPKHEPDSRFMAAGVSAHWHAPVGLPATGTVRSVPIAGTVSGFHARNAVVYLPPAYSAVNRPVLPVLVLVSGQPGSPESWLRSTDLVGQLDSFAAAHNGLAPVVVMPDPNGSDQANTMCMDSSMARADTYMSKDVPHWIKTHLDADTNPAHWAVGGFSYGGTCAMQMVTRHPGIYRTFLAISPEREPALAVNRSLTIERAFHGDAAAFDALVPLTLLAKNKYPDISGWFASGSQDATYSANVKVLQVAANKAGMSTQKSVFPGGHSWAVASAALPQGLAYVFARIGLP